MASSCTCQAKGCILCIPVVRENGRNVETARLILPRGVCYLHRFRRGIDESGQVPVLFCLP